MVFCLVIAYSVPVFASDISEGDTTVISKDYSEVLAKIEKISLTDEETEKYTEIQKQILGDIENEMTEISAKADVGSVEKMEVLIDFTNDLRAIKLSFSEPITIYRESITSSLSTKTSAGYKYETIIQAYNGCTTTVTCRIYYYVNYNAVNVNGNYYNTYCLQSSTADFSSTGYGHVSRIIGYHYQVGNTAALNYVQPINGNTNSSDRTDKIFSIYTSSDSAPWSTSNSTYTIADDSYSVGYFGSQYDIIFAWDIGGGMADSETIPVSVGKGGLPS